MASILENPAVRDAALPITVQQYHELSEAGIIPEKTELVRGFIVEKMYTSGDTIALRALTPLAFPVDQIF